MVLILNKGEVRDNSFDELNKLINRGWLYHRQVVQEPEERRLVIPITRFPLVDTRLLGIIPFKKRMINKPLSSDLIIEGFEKLTIEDNTGEGYDRDYVDILFGFTTSKDDLYLCSACESRGQPGWSLRVQFNEVKLTLKDKSGHDDQDGNLD